MVEFLIIVCFGFEGGSQRLGTVIDGFTDLWWFGKARKKEGLENRTAIVHRSFAPSSVEELGETKLGVWGRSRAPEDNASETDESIGVPGRH